MSDSTVFVGLDYHQDAVQVCVMDARGSVVRNRSVENSATAIVEAMPPGARVRAAVEACCGAADLAEELAARPGWSVHLAHAGYVARLKQSPDKTDWGDARLLADLTRVGYLPRVWQAPVAVRALRRVVRHRQDLVDRRRAVKLRIGAVLRERRVGRSPARRWSKAWRAWTLSCVKLEEADRWVLTEMWVEHDELARRIERAEAELERMTERDTLAQRLRQQRGVGLITSCVLCAEIGRFDRFAGGKQLARFCGLCPRNASSGTRTADSGLNRAASPLLRSTLIEAAWQIVRHDPHWRGRWQALCSRGKPKSLALAAIANRYVRKLYHQMKEAA